MSLPASHNWRQVTLADFAVIEPLLRVNVAEEAYFTLRGDASEDELKAYWFGGVENEVWALEENGRILGAFYQRCNHFGLGSHIANGGYIVSPEAKGRGVGRILGERSLERARERGFKSMQFNFVVSTNTVAVELWKKLGFRIIGTIPGGYHYKRERYDDAYIMFREI